MILLRRKKHHVVENHVIEIHVKGGTTVCVLFFQEREISELNQHLQYNVECLDRELQNALQVIETQKGQVKVVRDENDLAKIAEQEESIDNLQQVRSMPLENMTTI